MTRLKQAWLALRRAYYKLYIRWLALQWVAQINIGDEVIHNGVVRRVNNGASECSWTLTNPYQKYVPRDEVTKLWTLANMRRSYRSGVSFYTGYWLDIWVTAGIEPWVRACSIWPKIAKGKRRNGE